MQCHVCGGETPGGKPFCANCGAPLSPVCANCGAELIAGKPFCAECGTPVGSAAAQVETPPALAPVAERRLCSVLFVDLVGFTPLAESADPEEVRELLSGYFERAQAIVSNYGGTIEKFIGDAVMAVWGAPVANEDDAERSVRAALDLVAAVGDLGRQTGRDGLAARAGIVTGEAAVTVGKVSEGMVLGDTVNSASRLQTAAAPGTVLVDEVTWRASSGAIAYADAGEFTLKGKSEPVAAWQPLRVVAQRKGLGRTEGLEPPFVGRDDELRLVKDLLHATAREHRARLVSVTGVPGIGKSRLAWEFLKYVDGLAETVYWHQGRSASYGEGITFGALGEMVRMRAGINEAEGADVARTKLADCVAEHVDDAGERTWIEPRLAHLLGLADAPGGDREELFSAWRTFFERISALGTTVLVFEDLQWADPGLVDFVESILEWSRAHPIMVVTLSRPELRDSRPNWGASQRSFTSLHLDPLSDVAMRALLDGFVAGLPDGVASKILSRAEGVPLYAVETLRMLTDRGVLVAESGRYRVEGELDDVEVPETLHALVASRLDGLPPAQRALLQDAAVLGTAFLPESLAVVHGSERGALDAELRDLVRKEFLRFDSDPRSPERGQFGFVQGVIAEVALSMLARRDRAAKHLLAAHYYAALDDDEMTAVVAAHYASAHRASPDSGDAAQTAASACEWLGRAGDRALSLGSPGQAQDLYEQALSFAEPGALRASLLERAGDAATRRSDYVQGERLLEEAIALHRERGDLDAAARVTVAILTMLLELRQFERGRAMGRAAYDELSEGASRAVRAELATALCNHLSFTSEAPEALVWADLALQIAEETGDESLLTGGLRARANALFNLGRIREAGILTRGVIVIAEESGQLFQLAFSTMMLSLYVLADDPAEMIRLATRAAELAHRGGHRKIEHTNLLNSAETAIQTGRWDLARSAIDQVLADEGVQDLEVDRWVEWMRAALEVVTGDVERARERMRDIDQNPREEFVLGETTRLNTRALFCLATGEFAESQAAAAEAVALDPTGVNAASAIGFWGRASLWLDDAEGLRAAAEAGRLIRGRWMAATCDTFDAGVLALEGNLDEAAQCYESTLETWRELECVLDLALTELDMVHVLGAAHPSATVGKEADDVFSELGAAPFLARLRAERAAPAS